MRKLTCLFLTMGATLLASASQSQSQTVQGDILRGKGRYLEGAGWYNLNSARAGRINVETWKSYNKEVQRIYRDYMIDRAKHIQYRKGLTNKLQDELMRKIEEDQRRWRESPTAEDIASGDALNALAGDLADPSISPSSWRTAEVKLPTGMSLTMLAFKVADTKKSSLMQSTVAVDRMLIKDRWPLAFRRPEIERECQAYEKAIKGVVEKCRTGVELQAADYDNLRNAVTVLLKAVETDIPSRDDQRRQAREYARRLDDSSKLFAEQAYAEQLIRDVSEHQATSVAELLAFMRDYRLLFADPGTSPEVASLYEGLYGLLRQQKDALGIEGGGNGGGGGGGQGPGAPTDIFVAGSVWSSNENGRQIGLRVTDRSGRNFHAVMTAGKEENVIQEVEGEISDTTITWRSSGGDANRERLKALAKKAQFKAQAKKGMAKKAMAKGQGIELHATLRGNELHVTAPGQPKGYVLKRTR